MLELFGDSCSDVISWLNSATFYFAFVEGWAMYAESPLVGSDTDLYEDKPLYKYGMLTSVVRKCCYCCCCLLMLSLLSSLSLLLIVLLLFVAVIVVAM